MYNFIARPKTIKRAINASMNRIDLNGKIKPDGHIVHILEDVLMTGKPDQKIIDFHAHAATA